MKHLFSFFTKYFFVPLSIYSIILIISASSMPPYIVGEWDDYALLLSSFITDYNFTVSQDDIIAFKQIFPALADRIDEYNLSGHFTKEGYGIPWYFPTYSLFCLPALLVALVCHLDTVYAFQMTNTLSFLILLWSIYYYLKTSLSNRILLILCLMFSPVFYYLFWISAETFIFSILGLSLLCWYNNWHKRSALFLSLAGSLNPTILVFGMMMIIEYLTRIYLENKSFLSFFTKRNIKKISAYACCYIPAILPFLYNYYYTKHINLTASYQSFLVSKETIFQRFIAYLIDFNFGIFPYFPFIFILAVILLTLALIRRHFNYIKLILSFLIIMWCYSIMTHINSGMSQIARYNLWNAVILLFAVALYYNELLKKRFGKYIAIFLFLLNIIYLPIYLFLCANTSYTFMTPFAKYILNNYPALYNPLPSTFNSRINHIDGGYKNIETPIFYKSELGFTTKILLTKKDIPHILKFCTLDTNTLEQLKISSDDFYYLSFPQNKKMSCFMEYTNDMPISLYIPKDIAIKATDTEYIITGFFSLNMKSENIIGKIYLNLWALKNNISIFINNTLVPHEVINQKLLRFKFKKPHDSFVIIEVHSQKRTPSKVTELSASELLKLGFIDLFFTEQ